LIVTAGCGRARREGGPIEKIHSGDIVWFTPGEKHWHGASPITALTQIEIAEPLNGNAVDRMENGRMISRESPIICLQKSSIG
jgi:quercetin dioxygenase-like cupin family protein